MDQYFGDQIRAEIEQGKNKAKTRQKQGKAAPSGAAFLMRSFLMRSFLMRSFLMRSFF
jgi:hypothetical protein